MIDPDRRAEILLALDEIEHKCEVKIILAIESGSRAWGFPSADSDYDVRIIYAHPRDWYLSVFEGRDVIEQAISGDLDIGGWDLRKTLRLLAAGNAVVHEWLASPIVYRQDETATATLKQLAIQAFDPRATYHHYLSMAAKKLDVIEGEQVTAKRFLYGMRTLLCARWVVEIGSAPPMRFADLLQRYVPESTPEAKHIANLMRKKALGSEKDIEEEVELLLAYSRGMISTLKNSAAPQAHKPNAIALDSCFRDLLR